MIHVRRNTTPETLVRVNPTWWLLMTWRQIGARTSAFIMSTDDDLGLGLKLEFEIEPHAKELFILICSAEFAHFLEITNMLIKFS